ncbi:leukocyte elastase inhibitor-like [Procambarus clarkii]|uniref:leukocyte elastase inhibitor-like n=1 Tax=Procambarus clarkii TaxID=6728 RepID=UPI003743D51E
MGKDINETLESRCQSNAVEMQISYVVAIERLGSTDLFTDGADLTVYDPSKIVKVGKTIHKAVVEVNEEGAEAAAATALIGAFITFGRPPPVPREFTCDRPFIFLIRDNHTNNILFIGVYRKP